MKKITFSIMLAVMALLISPQIASANNKWSGTQDYKKAKIQTLRCNFYDWRQAALFNRYDQNNHWLNYKIQYWINAQNNRNCVSNNNTVDTLVANGNFKTLVTAVGAAGLAPTLANGNLTVFAPTDQAFAKLPAGTVEALLSDIPTLTSILTYHVVDGKVPANVAKTLTSAPTVNGQNVTISVKKGKLFINDSRVVLYDIKTSNGIIHVIDTVLLPQ